MTTKRIKGVLKKRTFSFLRVKRIDECVLYDNRSAATGIVPVSQIKVSKKCKSKWWGILIANASILPAMNGYKTMARKYLPKFCRSIKVK